MTTQSVTRQPCSPLPERLAHGVLDRLEEGVRHRAQLHLQLEADARADRAGCDAQADGGEEGVRVLLVELDRRARADGPLDAQRGRLAEGDVHPELIGQRGLDDLLLDLAVEGHGGLSAHFVVAQADQRVLLGESGEREVQGATVGVRPRDDNGLQGRRREDMPKLLLRYADRVADPDVYQAAQPADPARRDRLALGVRAMVEDADRGDPALLAGAAEGDPVADAEGAGEHPRVRDLLPRETALDLEHRAGERALGSPSAAGRSSLMPVISASTLYAGDGGAEVDGVHEDLAGLGDEGRAEEVVGHGVLDVRGEQFVVVLGEDGRGAEVRTRNEPRVTGPEAVDRAHRHDGGPEPLGDLREEVVVARASSVDLVDEEEGGDAEPLERAHQDAGLRLHTFYGRDDQDDAVEHAQDALHLGDEVRVAGVSMRLTVTSSTGNETTADLMVIPRAGAPARGCRYGCSPHRRCRCRRSHRPSAAGAR